MTDLAYDRVAPGSWPGTAEAVLAEALEAEERSRRLLADATHQLRTPIAGIQACAEALLRGVDPADGERLLQCLVREASRAARLVTDVLDMARHDRGPVLVPRPTDLVALCDAEVERARQLAPHLEIVTRVEATGTERPHLDGDAVREVLANLLDNARRHAVGRIEVSVGCRGGIAEVTVGDDGPGLDPAVAARAFERFVSLDGKGGSGLGLPIARDLARAQGGDLTYHEHDKAFVLRVPTAAFPSGNRDRSTMMRECDPSSVSP